MNILSSSNVKKKTRLTYDSDLDDGFIVNKGHGAKHRPQQTLYAIDLGHIYKSVNKTNNTLHSRNQQQLPRDKQEMNQEAIYF